LSRRIIYERGVQSDLREILVWHAQHGEDLAKLFEKRFEDSVRAISDRPFSFGVMRDDIRRAPIDRFPHGVFFRVLKQSIHIIGVIHGSRSPDVLKGRSE